MEVDGNQCKVLRKQAVFILRKIFPYFRHEDEQSDEVAFNPLQTKRRLLYLKTQSVPLCKHFSSRL